MEVSVYFELQASAVLPGKDTPPAPILPEANSEQKWQCFFLKKCLTPSMVSVNDCHMGGSDLCV